MTAAVGTDFSQFSALRQGAERDDPAALRAVASQFEALFVQSLLRNMRECRIAEPVFGSSDQHDMYQDMMDRQLSLEMSSGRGIGLAEMLVRQLGGEPADAAPTPETFLFTSPAKPAPGAAEPAAQAPGAAGPWSSPADFARDVWPHARRAAERLGVAPEAVFAQAALETGWGEHVMPRGDGASSLNLFGIKAGSGWPGEKVTRPTLEYDGGVARREQAAFRAYPDLATAFDDYAALLSGNPRYADVCGQGADGHAFARALQEAGYATDPLYARKISRILESDTLRALKNEGALPTNLSGAGAADR